MLCHAAVTDAMMLWQCLCRKCDIVMGGDRVVRVNPDIRRYVAVLIWRDRFAWMAALDVEMQRGRLDKGEYELARESA